MWRRYLLGLLGPLGFSKGGAHGKWRQFGGRQRGGESHDVDGVPGGDETRPRRVYPLGSCRKGDEMLRASG